jgi:hypothetical protein
MSEKLFKRITAFYKFTKEIYTNNPEYMKQFDEFLKKSIGTSF